MVEPHQIQHATAKSLYLWLTLCDPMDCSLPGSSVYGILQARIPKWSPWDFSKKGIWTYISYISCIGRQTLYH